MAAYFWVTGGTGNWNSASNWALTSGGVGGVAVPGSGDTAAIDVNSGSGSVTLDISPTIQILTMTGFTGTLAFGTNTISLNSTGTIFTGATTMTVTGTPQIICTGTPSVGRTITPTAVTETNSISFRITGGTATLTLTAGSYRDLDFTDGTNPTGFAGAITNTAITVYGNLKCSTSGMVQNLTTAVITFAATSGTKTITTAAVVFDRPFTFNGVGGTWQLQDALTSGSSRACTLTNGTLDLNGYTLTTGIFSSSNSNTRTLAFGAGKIVLTGSATTLFTTSTATNLTVTGTNPLIQLTTNATTSSRGVTMGAAGEANAISIDITAGSDTIAFGTTNGSFKNVNFTGFTGTYSSTNIINCYGNWNWGGVTTNSSTATITFVATSGTKTITSNGRSFGGNVTLNGIGGTWLCADALTTSGALTLTNGTLKLAAGTTSTVGSFVTSGTNPKYLLSSTTGIQATISDASGTNTVSYLTIQDSNATGGAIFDATDATNVDAGNNTGWLFSTTPSIGNEITMRLRSFTQPRRF